MSLVDIFKLSLARFKKDAAGATSVIGPDGKIVSPNSPARVAFFGDSITQQSMSFWLPMAAQPADNFGTSGGFIIYGADWTTPSGAGTLAYDRPTKTLTWTPFGSAAGPATDASVSGILYIPGPTAGSGIYLSWFGKSRTYVTGSTTLTIKADGQQQWNWNAYGFPVQAMAYAGQRFVWANYAGLPMGKACYGMSSGQIIDMIDAQWQWSSILSDIDIIAIGTNSASAGFNQTTPSATVPTYTAAQMIAHLKTLIDMRRAVTPRVIVCTIPPKGASNEYITQQQQRAAVNAWIFDYCKATPGLTPFDLNGLISDPTNGFYLSGYTSDSIHPSNIGAQAIGAALGQLLLSLYPAQAGIHASGYFDTYDATYNSYGNMLPIAGMGSFENAGGSPGTGASGVVPTGYTMSRDNGAAMTATGSKVARTDGVPGNWYQVVLAGATANENVSLRTTSITSAVAGDVVEALLELNIPASSLLYGVNVTIIPNGVAGRSANSFTASGFVHKDGMGKLWLRTAPYTVPVGATSVAIYVNMSTQAGGSGTIQLGHMLYRKVRPGY